MVIYISGGTTRQVNELIIIASLTILQCKYIDYDKLCLLCSSVSEPTTSFYIIPQWHALYQSHHSVMVKEFSGELLHRELQFALSEGSSLYP